MRPRRCTIDSSCVIALDHLDLMPQLSFLFSVVLVPKAVRREIFNWPGTEDRVEELFRAYALLQRCDNYEQGTVDFLLAERGREQGKDRGEVEAVVQAAQFGAVVIIDDRWGGKLAASYGLEFHGTFWVLRRFHELELLSSTRCREAFASLKERGMHLPWEIVNAFLLEIGQPPF
jgi:predicted nucleic acid-binding protein